MNQPIEREYLLVDPCPLSLLPPKLQAFPGPALSLGLCVSTPAQFLWAAPFCCLGAAQPWTSHQALTLFGVWSHFLHELNEVFQELGVVV